MDRLTRVDIVIPTMLILASLIPALGGGVRLANVLGDAPVTPDNARFLQSPISIVIHVIGSTLFALLGAFQFSPGFRRIWPGFHRAAGRVLVLAGVASAATGLWMTWTYDIPRSMQGPLVYYVRLAVGAGTLIWLTLAVWSIRVRRFDWHEAFMIRAYALAQGASMQAIVMMPWMLITGDSLGVTRDWLLTLSWLINVGLAEVIVFDRRRAARGS